MIFVCGEGSERVWVIPSSLALLGKENSPLPIDLSSAGCTRRPQARHGLQAAFNQDALWEKMLFHCSRSALDPKGGHARVSLWGLSSGEHPDLGLPGGC